MNGLLITLASILPACGPYQNATDCGILRWNGTLENWVVGDCDLDGDTDADDARWFNVFSTGPCVPWSTSPYWQAGHAVWMLDMDGDGDVDQDDWGIIQRSRR